MRGSSSLRAFSMGMFAAASILWGVSTYDGQRTTSSSSDSPLTEEKVNEYLTEKDYMAISTKEYEELINKTKKMQQQTHAPLSSASQAATIRIQQGAASMEVAHSLEEQGIVKSASEFQQYLTDTQLTDKLRVGTYQVTANMSFTEIARILTKQVNHE
ncbi:MAG TPA: endolytic transglycosylase MltG [Bacillus sp. (in: firmicutes)]|nr:endolytic transglycosylase MltG [Bacillus sp. (in: firmicutes)]